VDEWRQFHVFLPLGVTHVNKKSNFFCS
jgi:hypothetical protein